MKTLLNIASILTFCASALSAQAALKYHVLAITPGSAQGVNDKGDVVGTLSVLTNPAPPVWYPGGKYTAHAFLYIALAPNERNRTLAASTVDP